MCFIKGRCLRLVAHHLHHMMVHEFGKLVLGHILEKLCDIQKARLHHIHKVTIQLKGSMAGSI